MLAASGLHRAEQTLVRDARQHRAGLDQPAQVDHLPRPRSIQRLPPGELGIIDRLVACAPRLPDRVMPVGHARPAREDRSVDLFPHLVIAEVAVFRVPGRPRGRWMILVIWFGIQHRLGWPSSTGLAGVR